MTKCVLHSLIETMLLSVRISFLDPMLRMRSRVQHVPHAVVNETSSLQM